MDWDTFSEEIREKFLPPHLLSTLIHQLDNLNQDRQESLASYAARTLTLIEQLQLLPEGKLFAAFSLVCKRFINGVRSHMSALLLNQWLTLHHSDEVDFRQLREYALKIDNQTRTKDPSGGVARILIVLGSFTPCKWAIALLPPRIASIVILARIRLSKSTVLLGRTPEKCGRFFVSTHIERSHCPLL